MTNFTVRWGDGGILKNGRILVMGDYFKMGGGGVDTPLWFMLILG